MELTTEHKELIVQAMANITSALLVAARVIEQMSEKPTRQPPVHRGRSARMAPVIEMPRLAAGA